MNETQGGQGGCQSVWTAIETAVPDGSSIRDILSVCRTNAEGYITDCHKRQRRHRNFAHWLRRGMAVLAGGTALVPVMIMAFGEHSGPVTVDWPPVFLWDLIRTAKTAVVLGAFAALLKASDIALGYSQAYLRYTECLVHLCNLRDSLVEACCAARHRAADSNNAVAEIHAAASPILNQMRTVVMAETRQWAKDYRSDLDGILAAFRKSGDDRPATAKGGALVPDGNRGAGQSHTPTPAPTS